MTSMFHEQLTKNLKEGEALIRVIRRDLLASIRSLALASVLILLDFFLLTFFVSRGTWGVVVFGTLFLVAFIIGVRAFIEWQLNAFLLTNERVIHVYQKGFFTRMVSETTYGKITDVKFSVRGPLQTLLGLGTVEVQTEGQGENLAIEGVRRPSTAQALITDVLRTARAGSASALSAQELVEALARAKEKLGDEAFRKIVERRRAGRKPRPSTEVDES